MSARFPTGEETRNFWRDVTTTPLRREPRAEEMTAEPASPAVETIAAVQPRKALGWRRWLGLGAVAIAIALRPVPAHAIDFGDSEVVAEDEMAGMRGGFILAGGYQIDFGAIVKTFIDGELALETVLSWSQAGVVVEQSYGQVGQPLSELANDAQGQLHIPGLTASGAGFVLSDGQGSTAVVHRVIDGQFQNFLVNDASGRDIRQEIELTITLPGFEAAQDVLSLDKLGLRIADDMGQSYGF